jgi:hypothetical protein
MLMAAALIGGLAAGAAIQRVASQAPVSLIYACVNSSTNAVRMSPTGGPITCVGAERRVQWNQQGVQGSPGPQGETGEQGPEGPPGVTETYMVSSQYTLGQGEGGEGEAGRSLAQVPSGPLTALCTPGDLVLSGGFEMVTDIDGFTAPPTVMDRPIIIPPSGGGEDGDGGEPTPGQQGWMVSMMDEGGLVMLDVYALCSVAPETETG